jgi:uncharacterized membrane protein
MHSRKVRAYRDPHVDSIARGLGWFSVGLGLAQILAPRTVCRLVGLPPATTLMRLCGLRELACGIGIVTQRNPAPWLEARVAGDAIDLACLAVAAPFDASRGGRIGAAAAVVAGVTALDVYCSGELARRRAAPLHIADTITIDRPAEALYAFWRDLSNLPRVMPHVKSVRMIDAQRSHWTAHGPEGLIEWDSEIIDDRPNQRLAWRSLDGSPVFNAGSVRFDASRDGGGTRVTVELLYDPPTGTIGASLAKLLGRSGEIRADLTALQRLVAPGSPGTSQRFAS